MIDWLVQTVGWMFWTVPSTIFILSIFGAVAYLIVLSHFRPNIDRKGFLPIETGRGDRLFIGVLSNIVFFLLWLGFVGDNFLIVATIIVVIWFFIVNKWG
jgi:predicted small integral membrane protein